ncbi:hypothetical protein BDW59DRAFT_157747 [Aspergillus cavernicola]|uniref:Uncharacterized protein n=1 Tax=Aspergillus cavernicola TaxID=176166 RepID=A0ABR4IY54_9EURO
MRFLILTLLLAIFATMASGHTVHCAGKAIAAPVDSFGRAINYLRWVESMDLHGPGGSLPSALRLDPNSCGEVYCREKTNIRWCNEDTKKDRTMLIKDIRQGASTIFNDCKITYRGKSVAGGVIDHPDKWTVIVQGDDKCK